MTEHSVRIKLFTGQHSTGGPGYTWGMITGDSLTDLYKQLYTEYDMRGLPWHKVWNADPQDNASGIHFHPDDNDFVAGYEMWATMQPVRGAISRTFSTYGQRPMTVQEIEDMAEEAKLVAKGVPDDD